MTTRHIDIGKPSGDITTNATDIKFGIINTFKPSESEAGELVQLPSDKPISYAVEKVCETWKYSDPENYALKFSKEPFHYVTEATRKDLSGKLLNLYYSPKFVCDDILKKINQDTDEDIGKGVKELAKNSSDPTVVEIFVKSGGLTAFFDLLKKEKPKKWQEDNLQHALKALHDLMNLTNDSSWESLDKDLISRVISCVCEASKGDKKALGPALQVLKAAAVNYSPAYLQVAQSVQLDILFKLLENKDLMIQQSALALLNALIDKADPEKLNSMISNVMYKTNRDLLMQLVSRNSTPEIKRELALLQSIVLKSHNEKRFIVVDPDDTDTLTKIKELFEIAFEFDKSISSNSQKRNYTRLGFQNESNPALDFGNPPGQLALDCMYYLAKVHTENYNKIVLEGICRTTGDDCPFAKSSMSLVTLLCDILGMDNKIPGKNEGIFYPFFFQTENPFAELYCVCSQLVTKTWKEMKATVEDFDKVFDVVRDQILRALQTKPESFDKLRLELNTLTYTKISEIRQKERSSREQGELNAKPIQDLRRKLQPEMCELIKQNRVNYLIAGTRFNKTKGGLTIGGKKEIFWFCRLSPNGKVLHHGDCDEKATPLPDELPKKVNVSDIKDLYVGKDCPHSKKKTASHLAFSIVIEKDPFSSLDFVAPDEKTFNLWTDGINALLGKDMTSAEFQNDLDTLLNMEIKLRLLELEGIPELPQEAPQIPELPPDFDFSIFHVNG